MTLSLRARLAASATAVFGLLFVVLAVVSYQVMAGQLSADVTERLSFLAEGLSGYLHFTGDGVSVLFDDTDAEEAAFVHEATRFYQVVSAETGRVLARSKAFAAVRVPEVRPGGRPGAFPRVLDVDSSSGRIRVQRIEATTEGRGYILDVGTPLAPMQAALGRYRELLEWGVPVALLLAAVTSWWVSSFALRPLSRLAGAARQIDVTTIDRRLPVRGAGDELDLVASAFNDTLGRLDHAIGEMRQFSAALAHELRTPLAAIRGEIELSLRRAGATEAQRDSYASQLEEVDRLTRLIDQILTLARAEAGQIRLAFSPVDLSALADAVVEQVEPLAEARSIALRYERQGIVMVDGDEGWLRRLLLNLLGNAIKFTDADGRIVVRVSRAGESARIDVQDTGAGLTPEDARQIFERFFRADAARSSAAEGAGLGLSLVQWIAAQHHGTVTVQSHLGVGSTFSVSLPIGRASSAPKPA